MTDLEVCRLSAEALEKRIEEVSDEVWVDEFNDGTVHPWNPLEIAEQALECMAWLLNRGLVELRTNPDRCYWWCIGGPGHIVLNCPARQFFARAVAELQKRKEKA